MKWCIAIVLLAACFDPAPFDAMPCDDKAPCPDSYACTAGVCVAEAPIDEIPLATDCACGENETLLCPGAVAEICALGCVTEAEGVVPAARCKAMVPSNNVLIAGAPAKLLLAGQTTFNTDTGEISGSLVRPAGEGELAGIRFAAQTAGGAPLGVFTFDELSTLPTAIIRFTGRRAAVFAVHGDVTLSGVLDGSGGCYGSDRSCAGPGGGAGAPHNQTPGGCGPGGGGTPDPNLQVNADAGGGGGGGGTAGGKGGDAGAQLGGRAGSQCMANTLEPLVGGSGGGGGASSVTATAVGGGGGGALQISSLGAIRVFGTITMGGAGGAGGAAVNQNATGGAGGGGGGSLLLEAPHIFLAPTAQVAANGGGGGGGGQNNTRGGDGAAALSTQAPALGGTGASGVGGTGGTGGTGTTTATTGTNVASPYNGGGGGGGVGRIFVRTRAATLGGLTSPAPELGTVRWR